MRHTDRPGRYGGEEFLMLLTATPDDAAAQVAANGESIEQLLTRTDCALYAAKRAGRNCIRAAPVPSTGATLSA